MSHRHIAWLLPLLLLVVGCTVTQPDVSIPAEPIPTATLHPIFVPSGNEGSNPTPDLFAVPITETVAVETAPPIASPETSEEPEVADSASDSVTAEATTPEAEETRDRAAAAPQEVYTLTLDVPVLMYHRIAAPGEPVSDFVVEAEMFRNQLGYLASNRYNTIDFYDLTQALKGEAELPENPIILTFDDGYRDNYENAFGILNEFEYTGTFFLETDPIEDQRIDYMNWDMVLQMASAGNRFEPHSRTGDDLKEREQDYLIWQILGSQETIAERLGYTPRFFAYPRGQYDETVLQLLEDLDFWGALTVEEGTDFSYDQRYVWPRLFVPGDATLGEFAALVTEGTPVDIQRETSAEGDPDITPTVPSPTATITATGPISVTIYNDNLDPNWAIRTSPSMRFRLQDGTAVHDGYYATSINPGMDFDSLYFQVRPDASVEYPRDQVIGLSFWLYSADPLATNDLGLAISGSDDYPYWVATDGSVNLREYDPIFDEEEKYLLPLNRAINAETWTRVEILLDDLEYDTDYEYVTGINIRNNAEVNKIVFIDQLELLLLADEPS